MELLLKIGEREIYPLVEIAKIERTEITETIASLLHGRIEKKVVGMYADGKISLWKAAEIWECRRGNPIMARLPIASELCENFMENS